MSKNSTLKALFLNYQPARVREVSASVATGERNGCGGHNSCGGEDVKTSAKADR